MRWDWGWEWSTSRVGVLRPSVPPRMLRAAWSLPPRQGTVCSDPQPRVACCLPCLAFPEVSVLLLPSPSLSVSPSLVPGLSLSCLSLTPSLSSLCPSLGCFPKLRRELWVLWRAHRDTLRGDPPLLCGLRQMSSPLCACSLGLAKGALGPSCQPMLCLALTWKPLNQMSRSSFQALL